MKKILIFALVCALATGVLFFGYLENLESATKINYEDVVVAASDIPAYTMLTADMLTVKKIPQGTAEVSQRHKCRTRSDYGRCNFDGRGNSA